MTVPVRFLGAVFLMVVLTAASPAQEEAPAEGSVEWIARSFLKEKSFPNRQRHYAGDMRLMGSRPTPGAIYHDAKYELDLRVNEKSDTNAALAATITDQGSNQRSDFYLFFRNEEGVWKLTAVRTFVPPRGMGQMYAAVASKGKDVNARDLREIGIMQALQFHDGYFKTNFEQRREKLDAIAATILKKGVGDIIHGGQQSAGIDKALWESVRDAGLNYVELQENGWIDFNATAFGQSAIGYLWVHPTSTPPPANPENYILVEKLDGPWYLYRRQ